MEENSKEQFLRPTEVCGLSQLQWTTAAPWQVVSEAAGDAYKTQGTEAAPRPASLPPLPRLTPNAAVWLLRELSQQGGDLSWATPKINAQDGRGGSYGEPSEKVWGFSVLLDQILNMVCLPG